MSTFKIHMIGCGPYHIDAEVFHGKKRYAIIRIASHKDPWRAAVLAKRRLGVMKNACDRVARAAHKNILRQARKITG